MATDAQRLSIAKIATAHGVKGLVKLVVTTDDPSLLETVPVYNTATGGAPLAITLKNPLGKYWLAAIEGVTHRDQAEALRHTQLWIDRAVLPAAAYNEYYAADLIGLTAVDESGVEIGKIIEVADFGASPLLEIRPAGKPSFYIPFTHEIVPGDPSADGRLIVIIPEGFS